jgi:hypothetical protein
MLPRSATGRWTLVAVAALVLYRSVPYEPDANLRAVIAQHLRFDYTQRRAPELNARAAERSGDALLAATDDVLNARVEVDSIGIRGPLLPPPLPRWIVAHVRYRVMKGRSQLESSERCVVFRKVGFDDWRHAWDRQNLLACLAPI